MTDPDFVGDRLLSARFWKMMSVFYSFRLANTGDPHWSRLVQGMEGFVIRADVNLYRGKRDYPLRSISEPRSNTICVIHKLFSL